MWKVVLAAEIWQSYNWTWPWGIWNTIVFYKTFSSWCHEFCHVKLIECQMNYNSANSCYFKRYINSLRPSGAIMRQSTNHHWFRWWLVAWSAPSHYLNQCWDIVNWTLRNKLQWNFNWNSYLFIQENAIEMSSGKWRPFCLGLNVLNSGG